MDHRQWIASRSFTRLSEQFHLLILFGRKERNDLVDGTALHCHDDDARAFTHSHDQEVCADQQTKSDLRLRPHYLFSSYVHDDKQTALGRNSVSATDTTSVSLAGGNLRGRPNSMRVEHFVFGRTVSSSAPCDCPHDGWTCPHC